MRHRIISIFTASTRRPRNSASLRVYGSDAPAIEAMERDDPALAEPLHPALPYTGAEVVWAARHEMARTVEDVLARRTRALFLNARAAIEMAPRVAALMAANWARRRLGGQASGRLQRGGPQLRAGFIEG